MSKTLNFTFQLNKCLYFVKVRSFGNLRKSFKNKVEGFSTKNLPTKSQNEHSQNIGPTYI